MIKGIGMDLENTKEFQDWKKNECLIKKIFSKREIEYCLQKKEPHVSFAGKFCAKEAVIKAHPKDISIKDIEILNGETGKPYVCINGTKRNDVLCSISHCNDYTIALVIIN